MTDDNAIEVIEKNFDEYKSAGRLLDDIDATNDFDPLDRFEAQETVNRFEGNIEPTISTLLTHIRDLQTANGKLASALAPFAKASENITELDDDDCVIDDVMLSRYKVGSITARDLLLARIAVEYNRNLLAEIEQAKPAENG